MAEANFTAPMHFAKSCKVGAETQVPIDCDLGHLGHDQQLTAKILRKRQEEMARRARLLDPRKRMGGVAHDVLEQQIAEKSVYTEVEKAEDAYFAQSAALQDQIQQTVEGIKAERARERQMDVVDYSLTHLRKEQRREYALSDPNGIKNDVLPDPDDPIYGPSSMLKFSSVGEETPEMKHARHQQQSAWLLEQIKEKEARNNEEKEFDRRYDERVVLASHVRAVCEEAERQEQKEEKCAEAAENLRIAQMVRERNKAKKDADEALKNRHLETVMTSDWYNEAHDWKLGVNGKLMRAEYKRLSIEEEQDVYNSNARQILDKRAQMLAAKEEEAHDLNNIKTSVAVLGAVEEERARLQLERRMKLVEENKRLALEKREAAKGTKEEYLRYDP